eukprot:9474066-Pyramimonas_sp.AAC.1
MGKVRAAVAELLKLRGSEVNCNGLGGASTCCDRPTTLFPWRSCARSKTARRLRWTLRWTPSASSASVSIGPPSARQPLHCSASPFGAAGGCLMPAEPVCPASPPASLQHRCPMPDSGDFNAPLSKLSPLRAQRCSRPVQLEHS